MSGLALPPLKVAGEDGWADLEFRLLGHEMHGDEEFHLFCVGAHHEGEAIAFNILWPTIWNFDPPRGAPRGVFAHSAAMAFVNAQPLHRSFLEALAHSYGLPAPAGGMANFTEVSAITLEGDPERVLDERVRLKLLFGAHEDSRIPYAELYLAIDVPERTVELKEKDPDWRAAILESLARGSEPETGSAAKPH
jgi:hypothetical protein